MLMNYINLITFTENLSHIIIIAEHIDILKSLYNKIENIYSNSFLLKLGDNWQKYD